MKKVRGNGTLFLILCFVISNLFGFFAQPVQGQDYLNSCSTLDAGMTIAGNQQLLPTSNGVILYELNSGTLVYSWNPDQMLDPSGMNKIMTALLALEHGNPDRMVCVSNDALSSVGIGALAIGLSNGEEMTLRDLLYCMMVGSANDAAAVIAEHIAGGQTAFVDMMNQKARELGCTNTVFMNPTGLSHESQYTTARDLAKITAAALEVDGFFEYFSAISYTVPATNKSEPRHLVTTNHMVTKETVSNFFDERVTAGKTGAFTVTDRSFICTAEDGNARYLSVVMGAQGTNETALSIYGNFKETTLLLNHGFNEYSLRSILTPDRVLGRFRVTDGENDVAVAAPAQTLAMLPKDVNLADISYRCLKNGDGVTAPVSAGQCVGTVEVWYGSSCIAQSELIAMHSVDRPGVRNIPLETSGISSSSGGISDTLLIIIIIVLAAILLTAVLIKVRRSHRRRGKKKK